MLRRTSFQAFRKRRKESYLDYLANLLKDYNEIIAVISFAVLAIAFIAVMIPSEWPRDN
jgi:hypothetical protein